MYFDPPRRRNMSKIIINIEDSCKSVITFDSNGTIIPIADVDNDCYHISEVTDIGSLTLVSEVIYQTALTLKYQLAAQGFVNKPLNKPIDGK